MAGPAHHAPSPLLAHSSNPLPSFSLHRPPIVSSSVDASQSQSWASPSTTNTTQPPLYPSAETGGKAVGELASSVDSVIPPAPQSSSPSISAPLPSISSSTNGNNLPAHLIPAAQPRFSWQYIWSFFTRAPRVRRWLFQREAPPATHVVQSLLSSPMLVGYIFGSDHERHRMYAFPDIGDLQTVFCRDGDAFLGFHFGFQGIQPVLPLFFQVLMHPVLANPNVRVRRTARQSAPPPYENYYLNIEIDWFESGGMMIITSVSPADPEAMEPTGLCPYVLYAEHRFFAPETADRLAATAERLNEQVDIAYFPDATHFETQLPGDFLDPPDDYFYLTVREPEDPSYHANLSPAFLPAKNRFQTFQVERDIPNTDTPLSSTTANSSSTSASSEGGDEKMGGALVHRAGASVDSEQGDVSSVVESGTRVLWKRYQTKVAQSRRTGIVVTMLGKKDGVKGIQPVFGRDSRYVFLSTSGINVNGRIQRLCAQLGIKLGSPLPDRIFYGAGEQEEGVDSEINGDGEIDISNVGSGVDTTMEQRRFEQGLSNIAARAGVAKYSARAGGGGGFVSQGAWIEGDRNLQELDPQGPRDEPGTPSGARHPKRRRCATGLDTVQSLKMGQPSLFPSSGREHSLELTPSKGLSAIPSIEPSQGLEVSPIREGTSRRSFDLDHILSTESGALPPINGLTRKDSPESIQEIPSLQDNPVSSKDGLSVGAENSVGETGEQSPKSGSEPVKGKGNRTVWTCDRCGVQIRGKKGNLNRHIANKHDNIRAFACPREGCGRRFQTRLNLVRHETAVHDGRPHTCPNCPRAFKYEDDLKAHIKSAHDEADATLACEVCGSCFGRRSTLNRHMAKVHKIKPQNTVQAQAV